MKCAGIPFQLMVLQFATTQRFTSVTFKTEDKSVFLSEMGVKVDKPYFIFELMSCAEFSLLSFGQKYFAFYTVLKILTTNVKGEYTLKNLDLGFSCTTYKKFKVSWIQGNLTLWHIESSKWQIIQSSDSFNQVQFSNIACYSRNSSAEWRVHFYDDTPATPARESCINF